MHQLSTINVLLAMAKKKSKRESLLAVDALQDLWLTTLLPDDRKLKLLAQVVNLLCCVLHCKLLGLSPLLFCM